MVSELYKEMNQILKLAINNENDIKRRGTIKARKCIKAKQQQGCPAF
jgi:hypothetical protein